MEPVVERPRTIPAYTPFTLPPAAAPGSTASSVAIAPPSRRYAPAAGLRINPRSERANRIVNVTLAAGAIVTLLPVFVAIAAAVRLTSRGPIIYRQTRVGVDRRQSSGLRPYDRRSIDLGGHVFSMYKFRTMTVDAEKNGITWAGRQDARVTTVGRILRKTRLDELPQLFNVLRGDMNIVGPRPERPSIFLQLRDQVDRYALRQRAKPGITGLAQIHHGYDQTIADVRTKVSYDLAYMERQSLAEDFRIMLRTLPVMVLRKGAQ